MRIWHLTCIDYEETTDETFVYVEKLFFFDKNKLAEHILKHKTKYKIRPGRRWENKAHYAVTSIEPLKLPNYVEIFSECPRHRTLTIEKGRDRIKNESKQPAKDYNINVTIVG